MNLITFKSLICKEINSVKIDNISIASLESDYVLIEVKAAALHPYDLYYVDGRRIVDSNKNLVLGFEGSGIVYRVGSNVDKSLLGKKVAFMCDYNDKNSIGCWGQFSVTQVDNTLVIDEKIDFNKAAYLIGNPLTAFCLFNDMIQKQHKCIMLDTATSAFGKILIRLCLQAGIKMINIVRSELNLKILEEEGSTFNFSSNSSSFYKDINLKITELQPTIYFSCLGGGMQSTLFGYMPEKAVLCSLGNMNDDKLFGFTTTDFIFNRKEVRGWNLLSYLTTISSTQKRENLDYIQKQLVSGDKIFLTNIVEEVKLDQFEQGLKHYKENMSKGKIVIKP